MRRLLAAILLLFLLAPTVSADPFALYVVELGLSRLSVLDAAGNKTIIAQGPTLMNAGFDAFDAAGNVYVATGLGPTYGNLVNKIGPTGIDLGTFASTGLNDPAGGAFDAAGNLYVANKGNNTIHKFGPAGTDLGTFASTGLVRPSGVAFDAAGNLYVANNGNNTIHKFGPAGTDLGTFASIGLFLPVGLAFDAAGNLYVSNSLSDLSEFSNTIHEFGPTGTDLGTFASTGLVGPRGLAFDTAGNLYVANYLNSTIHKFGPAGTDLGTFGPVEVGPTGLAFAPGQGGLPMPNFAPAPEPSSLLLASLGLAGLALARIRRGTELRRT